MPGFWRQCRITFRWFRIAVWLAVLAALGGLLWLNRVGLPDFIKTSLVASLHERGVALEFSRMRLHFVHGVVTENVRIGQPQTPDSPAFSAREVRLRLNYSELLHRRLQVDGLVLRDGKFTLPLPPTNLLTLTNLQTELRFATNDTWTLDHFSAHFLGVRILLSGEVAHAPAVRHWKIFSGPAGGSGATSNALRQYYNTLAAIRFGEQPQLTLRLSGDANEVNSFVWRGELALAHAAVRGLTVDRLQTHFSFSNMVWRVPDLDLVQARTRLRLSGEADLATGNYQARLGGALDAASVRPFLTTSNAVRGFQLLNFHDPLTLSLAAAGNLTNLQQLAAGGRLELKNFAIRGHTVDTLAADFTYSNQVWRVTDLDLAQARTRLRLSGEADLATGNYQARLGGALDAASVRPFLTTSNAVRDFQLLNFHDPLTLSLAAAGNLTNLQQLAAGGRLELKNFAIRGHTVDTLAADFTYSNQVWRVTDLDLAQARTRLRLSGETDLATGNYQARLGGALDAASVRPFLTTSNAVRGFQLLNFHDPLTLSLAATGNLTNLQQLAAGGRLGLKDFAIRGQTVDTLAADFTYSNLTAEFFHPQVSRAQGAQVFAAEKLTLDLAGQKLIFAGGAGNMDPTVVARAIGPKTAAAMEPYRFLAIPAAQVNGVVPLRHDAEGELVTAEADLRFEIVNDTPFRWRRFETPQIRGTIHWLGDYLILTNAMAETYGGTTRGWGKFDLHTPDAGTDFSFFMSGTNADLHRMGLALWSPTNMLEGALSGEILVTSANSDDWRTWNGFGTMKLRDGLLWNVPIFGLISPALNKLSPGLGNNRATEATGRFTMTNGVIYTDSLKIHTALAQLDYLGTVDLAENVDARVTAQLMRATPLFGSLVSTVLWPVSKAFECKVTGTLGQPKPTPIYIPKLLLVPFHPIHSLEELLPSSEKPKG